MRLKLHIRYRLEASWVQIGISTGRCSSKNPNVSRTVVIIIFFPLSKLKIAIIIAFSLVSPIHSAPKLAAREGQS